MVGKLCVSARKDTFVTCLCHHAASHAGIPSLFFPACRCPFIRPCAASSVVLSGGSDNRARGGRPFDVPLERVTAAPPPHAAAFQRAHRLHLKQWRGASPRTGALGRNTSTAAVALSVLDVGAGPRGGAAVCVPRFDRQLAARRLGSGFFAAWLAHHAQTADVTRVVLYSDDCAGHQVLTLAQRRSLAARSGFSGGAAAIEVVDLAALRNYNGW